MQSPVLPLIHDMAADEHEDGVYDEDWVGFNASGSADIEQEQAEDSDATVAVKEDDPVVRELFPKPVPRKR